VSWRTGVERQDRRTSGDGDWAPTAELGLRQEGERHALSLDLTRALQPSAAGLLTRNSVLSLDARWRRSPTSEAYATATWARIDATTAAAGVARPDIDGSTRTLGAGLRWQAGRDWQFDVSWRHALNARGDVPDAGDHSLRLAVTRATAPLQW
jgi:hypothetical protein